MAEQPNDNYARHDHNHDDKYTPLSHVNDADRHITSGERTTWNNHITNTNMHSAYIAVPDYANTTNIMQLPWTATAPGQVALSWSIDYNYCVILTVNGIRVCAFSEQANGGFTTTFQVSQGDVVDLIILTDYYGTTNNVKPELFDISKAGELQYPSGSSASIAYGTGSYSYMMYARFTPYKYQTVSK